MRKQAAALIVFISCVLLPSAACATGPKGPGKPSNSETTTRRPAKPPSPLGGAWIGDITWTLDARLSSGAEEQEIAEKVVFANVEQDAKVHHAYRVDVRVTVDEEYKRTDKLSTCTQVTRRSTH